MDTGIFEYFKNNRAVVEVRHYFVENEKSMLTLGRSGEGDSEMSSEFEKENCDFITLGKAKIPLKQLFENSAGFNGLVAIRDDFNQNLGQLQLSLSFNYQA